MLLQFGRLPTIVVSSAETAREVMKTHDTDLCSRPSLVGTKRLSYDFRDMAFGPYSEYWREMRRISYLELFSLKRVHSFRYVREEEVAKWINSISESTPESDIAMFHELVNKATDMLSMFAATDFFPYFGWIIDVFTGHGSRLEKCFTALDTFYQKLIDEHLDSKRTKPEQRDIIDVLTELRMDQSGLTLLPISHIKGVLMYNFDMGMAELVRKPEKMKRVQDEIRTCVGKKGKVEESDINQLQYLKMVVKETFRLHPPVPLLIPRESINHCRRACPGLNMGIAAIELALANLLYSFNWELPNGIMKEDINMDEISDLTVRMKFPRHLIPIKHNWQ
ncbi:hypothetical protein IFM89_006631 [Coptis chinensis]|uniref:Cytochrome P450 n=1 Tax=Coptis chinensis TaxID=261450 RepID=A0A835HLR0_9MAGN|nr:hypothetical protein IFM89_006631 [Coptis chinensis]